MLEAHLPSLLAAITEADHPSLLAWALGCFAALALFVDRCTAIWDRFKAKPPASELFATKAEVRTLADKVEGLAAKPCATRDEVGEVHERVDDLMKHFTDAIKAATEELNRDMEGYKKDAHEVSQSLQAIHRTLGQLEGTVDAWKK